MRSLSPGWLIAAMFVAHVLSMTSFVTFPALLPAFMAEWDLTNAEAGWISGVYFAGYVAAVPVLTSLTDRVDPKRVFLAAMALGGVANLGFALSAGDVWTASLWRGLQGIGFAGTYMPGLKALADAVPQRVQSRAVGFYTATFPVGAGYSFFLSGQVASAYGWQWTFGLFALGPLAGFLIAAWALPARRPTAERPSTALLDFRPVFRNNRSALGFMVAYFVHNFESSTMRAFAVAFLAFAAAQQATDATGAAWDPTLIAAVANLLGLPAIVSGNEIGRLFNRRLVIVSVMAISATTGIALGVFADAAYWLVLALVLFYGLAVTADSGVINAGLVAAAEPRSRGAVMAMHSLFGFTGAFVGPVVFGFVLDAAGGEASGAAWVSAYAALAAIIALGALALFAFGRAGARAPVTKTGPA